MRFLSLFSGIEAASVAWEDLGWEPVAFSEIEAFPNAVLDHHYPDVPNLGDIMKVDWEEFKERYGEIDVIVGGSPCQSFSVAAGANRTGLDGESGLMYEYIRAVREVKPKWVLWENVPGVFSIDNGRAFSTLVASLEEIGYGNIAYRVFDSQFVRVANRDDNGRIRGWVGPVAQRRRRVYVVANLGKCGSAAAVLFERESVSGNTKTSKEKRKELTAEVRAGTRASSAGGGCLTPWDVESKRVHSIESASPTIVAGDVPNIFYGDDESYCILGNAIGRKDENGPNGLLTTDVAPALTATDRHAVYSKKARAQSSDGYETWGEGEVSNTLNTFDIGDKRATELIVEQHTYALNRQIIPEGTSAQGPVESYELSPTLDAATQTHGVFAYKEPVILNDQGGSRMSISEDVTGTLRAQEHGHQPVITEPVPTTGEPPRTTMTESFSQSSFGGYNEGDTAGTLRYSGGDYGGGSETLVYVMGDTQTHASIEEGLAPTITARQYKDPPVVCGDVVGTLAARDYKGVGNQYVDEGNLVCDERVRRLTPLECERLQGFPDGWTDIPYKGKDHPPDSVRYKALGNSFSVPVIKWIGNRIQIVQDIMDEIGI